MYLQRIFYPGLSINSYLIGDEKTKQCLVIDPIRNAVPYIVEAQKLGYEIVGILETHVHADFVSGAKELKHQLNEKPLIYVSKMGSEAWIPSYADVQIIDGDQIKLGEMRLKALHTPGHTFEHLVWLCYDENRSPKMPCLAFTGDCLFVGSIGRPDLLGKENISLLASELYNSLFDKLSSLPDYVEIFPGHGEGSMCGKALKGIASSTLGYERRFNPYLKKCEEAQWIKELQQSLSPVPPYFSKVKSLNVKGPPLLNELKTSLEIKNLEELFLIDVRHPELFAAGHLPGSLNIPYSPTFSHWAGWMLPSDQPIGLVVEKNQLYHDIVQQLRMMGFDQEIGVIFWNEQSKGKESHASFPMLDISELTSNYFILDVRTLEERQKKSFPHSYHIELSSLPHQFDSLPRDKTIAIFCRSGNRSSLAASILLKNGFQSVINVRGGI